MTTGQIERIETLAAGSPEWYEQRRARLGGSEIGAVLGLSTYESPLSLWLIKAGAVDPKDAGADAEWGNRLEQAVLAKWMENHPAHRLLPRATFVRDGWMLANTDGRVRPPCPKHKRCRRCTLVADEVVEIKTSPYGDGWGRVDQVDEEGDPVIPPAYLLQTRWYLAVLGVKVAHVAVLIGGCDYREYTVVQRQDHVDLMVGAGRAFLTSIVTGDRPDIDTHDRTYEVVRQLHPDIEDREVDLDPFLADAYLQAKRDSESADGEYSRQKSLVVEAMGSARVAMSGTRKIARRQTNGTSAPYLVCAERKAKAQIPTTRGEAA